MGKAAKYIVRLTDEALRARMLLKADVDGPNWPDQQITEAFEVGVSTLHRLRQRFVEDGLERALARQPPARRRAGSSSRGHRVQPGAGGARVLDAAPVDRAEAGHPEHA